MEFGKTNRNYKDRLFKFIFGNPENREWTLELYNAVNGTNYDNADAIIYNTIDDAIYMGMKNDVSFIIGNTINLYEQQSTYCPNMPLRFLVYLANLYVSYSRKDDFDIYNSTLQGVPIPKCVCFYNGLDKHDDKRILKFSEMYLKNSTQDTDEIRGDMELKVLMININYGHNKALLEKCKPLYEYSFFVDRIRFYVDELKENCKSYTLEDAINKAIKDLPKDFKILNFILKNQMEVTNMCLFEYDEEKHMRVEREEGRKEGLKEGKITLLVKLVNEGILTVEKASDEAGMKVKEFEKILTNKG